ncbi:serine/threonine-protein kinase [Streptomyces sp. ACA25]|uniref:serine/threonine-protein kinase n=1 Tax=Streptomyces sp. ACA25 TaxID=3022596 RepID=UPI00230725E8|nr:serine/threonine-protein kinase [Streptomyces sp. ACA25]MDB1086939.1 serine/threonine-protein kinase [Streptomyces sp. ACA25]
MTPHDASSPFRPLGPGDPREVAGYGIRARIGSGGMGSVYLSYTRGGQPIALKVIRAEFAEDPDFRRRFEAEVRAARRVQGLFTVPVLDSNTEGDAPWLATAYVPGLTLADVLRAHGPLPLDTVLLLIAGVAEALQSIHTAGVVHRDLKPGNILLAGDGPKVIDFGIARAADATPLTGSDVRVGTPGYMAPEQVTGQSATPATDIFSLGIIAQHAATGGHPFGDGSAHGVMYRIVQEQPDLHSAPEPLRDLIGACLAKDPAHRPSPGDIIETCRALSPGRTLQRQENWLPAPVATQVTHRLHATPPDQALISPATAPQKPASPPSMTARPTGGRRRTVALAAAAAAVGALISGTAVWQLTSTDRSHSDTHEAGSGDTPNGPGKDMTAPSGDTGEEGDDEETEAARTGGSDSAYWPPEDKTEIALRAPLFREDVTVSSGRCYGANLTEVYLDELTITTGVKYGSMQHLDEEADFHYLHCGQGGIPDDGIAFHPEIYAGTIDAPDPSPEECRKAAHAPTLPNPITAEQILRDTVLDEGMGICFETRQNNLVLLWIDQVSEDPFNENLRSYTLSATQWMTRE